MQGLDEFEHRVEGLAVVCDVIVGNVEALQVRVGLDAAGDRLDVPRLQLPVVQVDRLGWSSAFELVELLVGEDMAARASENKRAAASV